MHRVFDFKRYSQRSNYINNEVDQSYSSVNGRTTRNSLLVMEPEVWPQTPVSFSCPDTAEPDPQLYILVI